LSVVPAAGPHRGRVLSFDATRGLGRVVDEADGVEYPFHATAVSDGSRFIEAETPVQFTVTPGHGGGYEARSLSPAT
jgi:cold shock CspA family protein